jgi:dipeptidase E
MMLQPAEVKKMGLTIAIGGEGFSMEPEDLALARNILEQTGKPQPAVCFLPTAEGDSADSIVEFYTEFSQLACQPSHLSLFGSLPADIESFLLRHDVIFVGG